MWTASIGAVRAVSRWTPSVRPLVRQSERGDVYQRALDRLRQQGLVYACDCSRAEIAATNPTNPTLPTGGDELRYPGTCRDRHLPERPGHGVRVRLDQSVDSVTDRADGGSNVYLGNRGTMVMPAEVRVTFADRSEATVKLPIEMWNLGSPFNYRPPQKKRVIRAEVDPRRALPDIDRQNNIWH